MKPIKLATPFLAAVLLGLAGNSMLAADALFEFTFNDSSPFTRTTQRSIFDWRLEFQNQDGSQADWHGAPGSGVSGRAHDRAFDNSVAAGMGSGNDGGRAMNGYRPYSNLDSFTLSCWFKAQSAPIDKFARLFFWDGSDQLYGFTEGGLYLAVNSSSVYVWDAFPETNEWVFVAVR